MTKIIDARNLPCPQPVQLTTEALEKESRVVTIVDNETARENVSRLGKNRGCEVTVEEKEDGTYLTLTKAEAEPTKEKLAPATGIVLFIASDVIGRGEDRSLGSLIMHSFLNTVGSLTIKPESIVFMNNGVKLVTEGSPVLGELKQLESQGIELLACGTCLSRFQLTDKVAVGQVSNMYTLADTLLRAEKIVSL